MYYEIRAVYYETTKDSQSYPLNDIPEGAGNPDSYGIYLRQDNGELMHIEDVVELDKAMCKMQDLLLKPIIAARGVDDWVETHFQIITHLLEAMDHPQAYPELHKAYNLTGYGLLYELSVTLTNQFEEDNKDVDFDGDWLDAIDRFFNEEIR